MSKNKGLKEKVQLIRLAADSRIKSIRSRLGHGSFQQGVRRHFQIADRRFNLMGNIRYKGKRVVNACRSVHPAAVLLHDLDQGCLKPMQPVVDGQAGFHYHSSSGLQGGRHFHSRRSCGPITRSGTG